MFIFWTVFFAIYHLIVKFFSLLPTKYETPQEIGTFYLEIGGALITILYYVLLKKFARKIMDDEQWKNYKNILDVLMLQYHVGPSKVLYFPIMALYCNALYYGNLLYTIIFGIPCAALCIWYYQDLTKKLGKSNTFAQMLFFFNPLATWELADKEVSYDGKIVDNLWPCECSSVTP